MLGANLYPAEDVVLRFRAQALLLIRQKTGDRCSCRVSWSIGEHNIDLIAQLQIVHFFIALDNPILLFLAGAVYSVPLHSEYRRFTPRLNSRLIRHQTSTPRGLATEGLLHLP